MGLEAFFLSVGEARLNPTEGIQIPGLKVKSHTS